MALHCLDVVVVDLGGGSDFVPVTALFASDEELFSFGFTTDGSGLQTLQAAYPLEMASAKSIEYELLFKYPHEHR